MQAMLASGSRYPDTSPSLAKEHARDPTGGTLLGDFALLTLGRLCPGSTPLSSTGPPAFPQLHEPTDGLPVQSSSLNNQSWLPLLTIKEA